MSAWARTVDVSRRQVRRYRSSQHGIWEDRAPSLRRDAEGRMLPPVLEAVPHLHPRKCDVFGNGLHSADSVARAVVQRLSVKEPWKSRIRGLSPLEYNALVDRVARGEV